MPALKELNQLSINKMTNKNKKTKDYVIKSLIAGGISGCAGNVIISFLIAKTAVAPLDRVKILFQTSSPIISHHAGILFKITN